MTATMTTASTTPTAMAAFVPTNMVPLFEVWAALEVESGEADEVCVEGDDNVDVPVEAAVREVVEDAVEDEVEEVDDDSVEGFVEEVAAGATEDLVDEVNVV